MLISVANQLGVSYVGTVTPPTPSGPSIDTTDLMIWWDPGYTEGYDAGTDTLKNLAPTGTTWDAPVSLLSSGTGADAILNVPGRYIEYSKTGSGSKNYFAPNTTAFSPAAQAFTWIAWFSPLSLSGTFINIFPYQNTTAAASYVRGRADNNIWYTNSTTAGQDNWTFTPPSGAIWYMMAIASDNAGGSSSTPVSRSAYYNGVLDKTDDGTVTTLGLLSGYGFAHGDRSGSNRTTTTRSGASIFYTRKLSGAEILDIYNTYRPFYPETY